MAGTRNIGEYHIYRTGMDEANKLHLLTAEMRDNFFENPAIMNLLWGSSRARGEAPESFLDIRDAVVHRSITALSLAYLEHAIGIATRPQIMSIGSGDVIATPESEIKFETSQGHNYFRVEELQKQWFQNPDIVEKIREYEKTLNLAFDEFNLKFVLSRMFYSQTNFIFEDCEEKRIQERIADAMKPHRLYHEMDKAYYSMGNRFYAEAGSLYEKLFESDFGRFFILKEEEIQAGLSHDFGRINEILEEQEEQNL